jgi:ribosomal-protein-alanine N-acetyltransferase
MIVPVDKTNLADAAAVHAAAWRDSHRAFCSPALIESHTAERQAAYLGRKADAGSRIFLLIDDVPVGVVSVTGNLIEDLYVLPERQGHGYGTKLLRYAASVCDGTPTLWILENNTGARRLYERSGFSETGNRKITPGGLDEIEFAQHEDRMETERLLIDRVRESDREDYFNNISHDKAVLETFVCRYAESLDTFDFSTYIGRDDLFAIRLKESGRLIGIILYFDEADGVCEIGYGIGSAYWNRGYTTEAARRFIAWLFAEKGMRTVTASYFTGNDASRRVMEKCGMTYRRFSEHEFEYLGVWRDLTYLAIDAPENGGTPCAAENEACAPGKNAL